MARSIMPIVADAPGTNIRRLLRGACTKLVIIKPLPIRIRINHQLLIDTHQLSSAPRYRRQIGWPDVSLLHRTSGSLHAGMPAIIASAPIPARRVGGASSTATFDAA